MSSENQHLSFEETTSRILELMSKFIKVNTLFIAKNDNCTNQIIKALNQGATLVEESSTLPFKETYCKLAVDHGNQPLIIPDITKSPLTDHLNVTKNLGSGCFIGIPIYYKSGENYGTICGLDTKPFTFTDDHIEMFQTMASLLTNALDLDKAYSDIKNLSTPLVPITEGVAILPLIGEMNTYRSQTMTEVVVSESARLSLSHLVIDLSGLIILDDVAVNNLLNLAKMLKLLGVTVVITGVRPDMALQITHISMELNEIILEANLKKALASIGFTIKATT
ncbi:GAF domain-containing protein [Aciduricibacillus chroicocephali]|uniref:GAF domain-containing protein n=1 Tax=Aciduricibacillus chroicocephali TaxID=3054939 RepID=A0ABY9KUV8_9BACI|nr:GAF domain-containing protein [Bacillaceae bacterium 44XB]